MGGGSSSSSTLVRPTSCLEPPHVLLETSDLLSPRSQSEPPALDKKSGATLAEVSIVQRDFSCDQPVQAGAHHNDFREVKSIAPVYIEIRVRLIYGQKPTPSTTASYWLAVGPDM